MNNKPKYFLVAKIIGFLGVIVFIFGLVIALKGFGDFESNKFMIGSFIAPLGLVVGASGLITGFKPEITKMNINSTKYIQQQNKENLIDIATTTADITSEAITKTTKSINKGLENKIYCKHCGEKIDSDSKFCNKCGKEQ